MLAQLGRALTGLGEHERADVASTQAVELIEGLLGRLIDLGLRQSFSDSDLVASLRPSGSRLD